MSDRQEEIKDTIMDILEDDSVRVKELTYRDLSLDHSKVEIIVVLEKDDE